MSAENASYKQLADDSRITWEQSTSMAHLERYGVYSARYLADDPTRHWYSGENKPYGTASMVIFAYAGKEVGHMLISTLFDHLDECHACVHEFVGCETNFKEKALSSISLEDKQHFSEFQQTMFEVLKKHWADRAKSLLSSLKSSPDSPRLLEQLAVCFHMFAMDYRYYPELEQASLDQYVPHIVQILAKKGYQWLPGYIVLLIRWNDLTVKATLTEAISQNISKNELLTPDNSDMAGYYYALNDLDSAYPLKSPDSVPIWTEAWKYTVIYFRWLENSQNAKRMAITGASFLERAVALESCAIEALQQFALKQADPEKLVRQYCRVNLDTPPNELDAISAEFCKLLKGAKPNQFFTIILDLVENSTSSRAGSLAIYSFPLIDENDASKLLLSNPKSIIDSLSLVTVPDSAQLENAIKQALKQGHFQILSLLQAQLFKNGVALETLPNIPLMLRCIRNLAFLPVFLGTTEEASNSQQYGNFDLVIKSILTRLASCNPSFLTSIAGSAGTLSTLWLYESSVEPETSRLAQSILSRVDSSKINPKVAINEVCNMMGYIRDVKAYSLVTEHSMNAIKGVLSLVCAVGDQSSTILFWDRCWAFIGFNWESGRSPLRVSVEQTKQCLNAGIECAQNLIRSASVFLVHFDPQTIGERLRCLAATIVPGSELLRLFRKTGILRPAYDVICAMLEVLNSHNFVIPPDSLAALRTYFVAKHGNELEESEVKVLKYLAGEDRLAGSLKPVAKASPMPSPTPAPTPAPAQASTYSASTPNAPKTSIRSFFQTVPRDTAIANTQKQVPLPPPPKPKEGSRLALIREELDSKRKIAPIVTPKKVAENVTIHPARPSGFNKKEKPATTSTTLVSRPLPKLSAADSGESSSGDDSDSGDGLIALHKRKRNIDSDRFSNIDFQKKLRPPKLDEIAQEAARMKARIMANADHLHKSVLGWEFYSSGNFPPELKDHRIKVPNTFSSAEEYTKIMRPLLLMEVWQHIQQYRDSRQDQPLSQFSLNICQRTNVDDFIDFNVMMSLEKFTEMHISENDLLLLVIQQPPGAHGKRASGRDKPHCYAKVREGSITVHYKQKQVDLTLRTYKAEEFTKRVNQKLPIAGEKVLSLLTAEREYKALEGFEHCELRRQVLSAEPAAKVIPNESIVSQLTSQMGLNQSQARAAYQALNSTGFNLIQGPPGTGKTKTILSIIGAYFSNPSNKRILVCAPSNAAVDELLARIKAGTNNLQGNPMKLKAVRLGRIDTVHPSVADLCLDRQIQSVVVKKANAVDNTIRDEIQALRDRKKALHLQFDETTPHDLSDDQRGEIADELGAIQKQLSEKNKLLAAQREQLDLSRRERELEYRRVQAEILSQAQVVCCTLSGSASSILSSLEIAFKTVIIDEAAQSVELSALIPFRYGCNQCIMVGDPHQLPPTVLNKAAADLDYEQSLFTRIFKQHQDKVSMLDEQFRMHPDIAVFPSKQFYNGLLRTGPGMSEKTKRVWHESPIFRPYYFYNVKDGTHKKSSRSLVNTGEIEAASKLIKGLLDRYPEVDFTDKIGIVTPYKQQANSFRKYFESKLGSSIFDSVTISTIDAFQGQEKDIIIFSTVRASPDSSTIGFVGDIRRMNVAITRARASLWILGSASTLCGNSEWERLITDAQSRKLFATARVDEFCAGLVRCQEAAARLSPPESGDLDPSSKRGKLNYNDRGYNNMRRDDPRSGYKKHSRDSRDYRNNRDYRDGRDRYDNRETRTNYEVYDRSRPEYRGKNGKHTSTESYSTSHARAQKSGNDLPHLPPVAKEAAASSTRAGSTTPPVADGPYRTHARSGVFNTKASRKT